MTAPRGAFFTPTRCHQNIQARGHQNNEQSGYPNTQENGHHNTQGRVEVNVNVDINHKFKNLKEHCQLLRVPVFNEANPELYTLKPKPLIPLP